MVISRAGLWQRKFSGLQPAELMEMTVSSGPTRSARRSISGSSHDMLKTMPLKITRSVNASHTEPRNNRRLSRPACPLVAAGMSMTFVKSPLSVRRR